MQNLQNIPDKLPSWAQQWALVVFILLCLVSMAYVAVNLFLKVQARKQSNDYYKSNPTIYPQNKPNERCRFDAGGVTSMFESLKRIELCHIENSKIQGSLSTSIAILSKVSENQEAQIREVLANQKIIIANTQHLQGGL